MQLVISACSRHITSG